MSKLITEAALGAPFAYTDALNELTSEHIAKQKEDGAGYQKQPLRPSAAGKCERELAFELMEFRGLAKYEKETTTPELHRLFDLGHSIEYHVLKHFKEQFKSIGFSIKYQQQVLTFLELKSKIDSKNDLMIEGSIDFVLWSDGFRAIGDVKSKKEKFSSYRESSWEEDNEKYSKLKSLDKIGEAAYYADNLEEFMFELNDPFLNMNLLQLNLYANSQFIKERNIDHCVLVYYSKNTSRVREIRFRPSQNLYEYVLLKFTNAYNAVEANNPLLAMKEFNLGNVKCAFCPFNKECWSDDDPKKAFFKTLPAKRWPKDTSRLGDEGLVIEELYENFKVASQAVDNIQSAETELVNLLTDLHIDKVRFADGEIYEVKLYKSPKEHFRLKRGKL